KDLQDKYDVLKNQVNTFEEKNKEFNELINVLNKKNDDLLDQTKVLQDQLQVKHVVIDTHDECHEKYAKLEAERYEYMIRYSALFDNDKQSRKQIANQQILFDKMSVELVELDKHVRDLKNTVLEKDFKISELEECVRNKDLEIEKCLERLKDYENKLHKIDTFSSVRRPKHSDVIWKKKGSSNTSNVDLSSISHLKLNKEVKRYSRKDLLSCNNSHLGETSSAYVFNDAMKVYCNSRLYDSFNENNLFILMMKVSKLNKSLPRIVRKWLPKLQPLAELVDKQIPKIVQIYLWIINSGCSKHMTVLMPKKSCALENVDNKTKRKGHTFSSVRRPKHSDVIWKKKGSSNTSNVDLSSISHLKLNKEVKRYSRKDLLSCNNSHLGETSSAYVFNDAMKVYCNSRLYDSFNENNLFILMMKVLEILKLARCLLGKSLMLL
nr:hypothetical protein [Tanacetum cinerariifolium]